jgi:hypothetical protein
MSHVSVLVLARARAWKKKKDSRLAPVWFMNGWTRTRLASTQPPLRQSSPHLLAPEEGSAGDSNPSQAEMAEPSASSAAAGQTDAERMDALDRMLTRLALADDARLAPVLARVLPYAVTSLASPAPAVRKLVSTAPLPSPPALIRSEFQ